MSIKYNQETDCPICYNDMTYRSVVLGCNHKFHIVCLEKHFRPECPICNQKQTKVRPQGKVPKSSPGRTVRYISPNAQDEKINIIVHHPHNQEDKKTIEDVLTKKHRGENIHKTLQLNYIGAMKRIGTFSIEIAKQ